jgi:hypothetical protein
VDYILAITIRSGPALPAETLLLILLGHVPSLRNDSQHFAA